MDLSGTWRLALDKEQLMYFPKSYEDKIVLPDSLSNAAKAPLCGNEETGFLTDTRPFEGAAWFEREISVSAEEAEKDAVLYLERTRMARVFVDGVEKGFGNTLCARQRFSLGRLTAGVNTLTIRVSNTDYPTKGGHMTSPDTQTNWLGILGEMRLDFMSGAYPVSVMLFPDADSGRVKAKIEMSGESRGELFYELSGDKKAAPFADGKCEFEFDVPDYKLWDEYEQSVYSVKITCGEFEKAYSFGFRKLETRGRRLFINGNEAFLRGKHDGMIFPETGYAPMEKAAWARVFLIMKSYGINHYRFHTCCPPEAAFEAADEAGMYLQPELPFWGTVSEDENDAEQKYLVEEGFRILKQFGNHPSFLMMSLGNELWGSKERINDILGDYKAIDRRHLYTGGSNNFQFWPVVLENEDFFSGVRLSKERLIRGSYAMCDAPLGFIQTEKPSSDHCYDGLVLDSGSGAANAGGKLKIQYGTGVKEVDAGEGGDSFVPNVPIITHEVGQFESYPDFEELSHYKGSIKPLYLNVFRRRLEENGLFGDHERFFKASYALAMQCYKAECEAALGSDTISGFQLLDIQDFTGQGVATVGILNALLEPKGAVSAEEWRRSCSDTAVLASMSGFVYAAGDKISAGVRLFNVNPGLAEETSFNCTAPGFTAELSFKKGEKLSEPQKIEFTAVAGAQPERAVLSLRSRGSDIMNEYRLWVFPKLEAVINENELVCCGKRLVIVKTAGEAKEAAQKGERPIIIPERGENAVDSVYCTDFWNYPMFASISRGMNRPLPTGTLGLCINEAHPALRYFLSESFTTPQWYNFITHAHCDIITGVDDKPAVQMIDNVERCQRLGLLYEKDGFPVCTCRLWEIAEEPETAWLVRGLTEYYGG